MSLLQTVVGPEYYEDGMINRDVGFLIPEGCRPGACLMFSQTLNGRGICVT